MPYVLFETAFGSTSESFTKSGRTEITKERQCFLKKACGAALHSVVSQAINCQSSQTDIIQTLHPSSLPLPR